jgi:transcriptional regulator with XRE-family HTH domain
MAGAEYSHLNDQKFLRDLGNRLRQRRNQRQWTQAELADRCSFHRTFIGSVERGERNLSILNLCKIARALRVPLEELLDGLPR